MSLGSLSKLGSLLGVLVIRVPYFLYLEPVKYPYIEALVDQTKEPLKKGP